MLQRGLPAAWRKSRLSMPRYEAGASVTQVTDTTLCTRPIVRPHSVEVGVAFITDDSAASIYPSFPSAPALTAHQQIPGDVFPTRALMGPNWLPTGKHPPEPPASPIQHPHPSHTHPTSIPASVGQIPPLRFLAPQRLPPSLRESMHIWQAQKP